MRDIFPSLTHSILLVFTHIVYAYSNNAFLLMAILLCVEILHSPLINLFKKKETDNFNLSPKSEKQFMNDKRFLFPLYSIIILETITWIWALIVCSD